MNLLMSNGVALNITINRYLPPTRPAKFELIPNRHYVTFKFHLQIQFV